MLYYFIIHKPYAVLSQFSTTDDKKSLADFFNVPKDVYPVGRLDYDSEGLLLLTNDKQLNYRLLHPSHAHQRAYYVQVDGAIHKEAISKLQQGVDIHHNGKLYHTKSCVCNIMGDDFFIADRNPPIRVRKQIPAPWINMVLTEGKNRQVRKMTAQVGFPTLRLIRYRIEQIELGNLQAGEQKELSKKLVYKKLFHE